MAEMCLSMASPASVISKHELHSWLKTQCSLFVDQPDPLLSRDGDVANGVLASGDDGRSNSSDCHHSVPLVPLSASLPASSSLESKHGQG